MTQTSLSYRDKLRRALAQLPYLPRALGLVWDAAPGWTVAWTALLVLQGLLPAATVFLTKLLVDSMVAVVDSGGAGETLREAILWAVLMAVVMLLNQVLGSIRTWVEANQGELAADHVTALVHDKSMALDLAFYDSHEYYDHLHRARAEARTRPLSLLRNMGTLMQNTITLVAMAGILLQYGLLLPVALVLSTLPAVVVVFWHNRRQYRWEKDTTPDQRRTWYYDFVLGYRESAAELRLFDLGRHFRSRYQALRRRLRSERLALLRDQVLARSGAGLLGLLVMGGVMVWMLWQAAQGLYTLGDLALFYQAFNRGQGLMRTLLQNVAQIYSDSLYLGNLFEYLELEPQVLSPTPAQPMPVPLQSGIRFREVAFRYPDTERYALQGFNLSIPPGQTVALVGANGAGKTTLLKLLCRFYDPQAGSIEMDGIDLRELSLEELRRSITVLFQEPVKYQDTVADNIKLGDLAGEPSHEAVKAAARTAGADEVVGRLPGGYDALLGKWFEGGTDLSAGEWQRIALARAFYRQASIVLLDEPTSAMDSWAEADWLRRFRNLAQGRTAIIITHRFTTAMHAGIIHVMDAGRIVESGSHEELLALDGRYAESWREQMRESEMGEPLSSST